MTGESFVLSHFPLSKFQKDLDMCGFHHHKTHSSVHCATQQTCSTNLINAQLHFEYFKMNKDIYLNKFMNQVLSFKKLKYFCLCCLNVILIRLTFHEHFYYQLFKHTRHAYDFFNQLFLLFNLAYSSSLLKLHTSHIFHKLFHRDIFKSRLVNRT